MINVAKSVLTFGTLATLTTCFAKDLKEKRPNILFIFSDDHAVKSISAYGDALNKTPNIDQIAKDGAVFKNNFCANSICAPSRACVLTGKHSHMNGQMTNGNTFDGSQMTFPKKLQAAGYKTALIGKWHLRSNPTGFDHWMIYPGQGNYYNPDYIVPKQGGKTERKRITGYSVDVTTDLSIKWMEEQAKSDQPFLMMCQFKAPHRTWSPSPRHLTMYDDVTFPVPDSYYDKFDGERTSAMKKHRMGIKEHMYMGYDLKVPIKGGKGFANGIYEMRRMTPEQKSAWNAAYEPKNKPVLEGKITGKALAEWKYQRYIKDYLRCVAAVDDNIGRLLKFLKEKGLDENTIVVYSSDQGFYLGEHGWFDKRWMYEESFRQPLVMKWLGVIKPGSKFTKLTQNIDFAPTFLEAAGIEIPKEVQGKSMLPIFKDEKKAKWRDGLYYHYYESPSEHGVPFHYGVRTERYKLIHYYAIDEWELFDLEKDPNEMNSLHNHPEYKELKKKLTKKLNKLRKEYNCNYNKENPDPTLKRQLERRKKRNMK